jgi:antitoxin (DNA-binding transcriptional repressor) of toxin-antitoxin stability system
MEKATISEIKNRLSAYLRRVRAGQVVLIMDRNRPVARLERVSGNGPGDDRLSRLEQTGLVRRSRRTLRVEQLAEPAPKPKKSVLAALIEDRREGR